MNPAWQKWQKWQMKNSVNHILHSDGLRLDQLASLAKATSEEIESILAQARQAQSKVTSENGLSRLSRFRLTRDSLWSASLAYWQGQCRNSLPRTCPRRKLLESFAPSPTASRTWMMIFSARIPSRPGLGVRVGNPPAVWREAWL